MGFASLQRLQIRRSTSPGLASPVRSAFRVWLPSWRLSPFEPLPALFRADSAPGIYPSELRTSQKVSRTFPPGRTHVPFRLPVYPPPKRPGRPGRPRFLGFAPSGSPAPHGMCLASRSAGCSLGFCPSRVSSRNDGQPFSRPPLTRFADPAVAGSAGAPECHSTLPRPGRRRWLPNGRPEQPS